MKIASEISIQTRKRHNIYKTTLSMNVFYAKPETETENDIWKINDRLYTLFLSYNSVASLLDGFS